MILTKSNNKEFYFESFLNSKISSEQLETLLILVPTNRKLRDLKKKIINNFTDRPVSQIHIETLSTFSAKILREHSSFTQLSEAASTVLIKESAEALELNYFALYTRGIPFGTLDKIKNVISEYKKHGITPEILAKEAENLSGGEKNKALDICSVYKKYLSKCKKQSALEIGDIYFSINNLSSDNFQGYFLKRFPKVNTIVFEGFDEFTNLEITILNKLCKVVANELYINFDYYNNNEYLFSHLEKSYDFLLENGFKIILDKTPEEDIGFQKVVKEKLFKQAELNPSHNYSDVLFKSSLRNRISEVELIAKTIKSKLINKNTEPEKICVAFNNINSYSSIVRDIFFKYGIPINLTDRIHLKTSPPVIAALSLLELVEKDFHYRDLVKVLSSGFLQFEGIDLNNLILVGNKLKITSGLLNWELAINDALNLLEYETEQYSSEKSIIFNKAKNDINQLSLLLKPFRKKNSYQEFILNFKNLLLKLKLPCKVLDNSGSKEEEFIKAITVFLQTINEVLTLVNTDTPDRKYSLSFYIDQLRTISNWARFNIKEKSDYGILVTSVNEIRGLKFDYLFLGGMTDGGFPTKFSPEIFFSGSFQRKEKLHQSEERYHFYQVLCSWKKELYLSVPQNDIGSELVESTFIKDLEKLFIISELKTPSQSEILSNQQLQITFSKDEENETLVNAIKSSGLNSETLKKTKNIWAERTKNPFTNNIYSGFIGSEEYGINNFLKLFSNQEFSVSQLETFAKCPFKYFSERILKLKPIEEPTEEAEPIELGNVLHSILYDFYKKIVNNKLIIGPVGSEDFDKVKNILFEIAEDKISKLNLNSPLAFFEKEKILGVEGKKQNSILFKFLLNEVESEGSMLPELFEIGFGNFSGFDNNLKSSPLEIGETKLRGKIDRIDLDRENKIFNIIDYKLRGRKPSLKDLFEGLSLQLPVYLLAGEQILNNLGEEDYKGYKMIIYSLDFKDKNFGPLPLKLSNKRNTDFEEDHKLNLELTSNTKGKITNYHQNIKSGNFNLSNLENREEKVCQYCDFRSFCRMQEVFEV